MSFGNAQSCEKSGIKRLVGKEASCIMPLLMFHKVHFLHVVDSVPVKGPCLKRGNLGQ